ncbi:hypothetical protein E6O75_ATG08723 [Venturia nashicola]|uniref:Uncharacterized protein n=1 Tax=Venturia nashicola TaxID=86259 RepID=A0A4Z1NGV2_9PEZI|nr:hypothetical protein E6O75_ATG08723 [Venturia nashicola]
MDPLSITTSVVALGSAIARSISTIAKFRRDVQGVRGDLLRVAGELLPLQIIIEGLQEESVVNLPVHMHNGVMFILGKYKNWLWRKMEWAALGRTELDDLRSNLEANKVSLNLAIDLIDLSVTQDVKKDAGAVKKITNQILADTTDKKLDRRDFTQQKAATKPKSSTKTKRPDQVFRKPKKVSYGDTIISNERTCKHGEQPRAPRFNKKPNEYDLQISIQKYLKSEKSKRQQLLKQVEAEIETGYHPNRAYGLAVKAVEMAKVDLLGLLLKHGLSTSIVSIPCESRYDTATNPSVQSDMSNTSLLHIACVSTLHFPVCSVEIDINPETGAEGVDVRTNTRGRTPLMNICHRQRGD